MVTNPPPTLAPYANTPGLHGNAGGSSLAFFSAAPVAQPAAPTQPAATASTQTTPFGYSTQAQADAVVTGVRSLIAALSQALGGEGLIS